MPILGIKEGDVLFIPNAVPVDLTDNMADAYRLTEIFGWPLAIGGKYTSFMKFRIDPFSHMSKFHKGVDIKVPYGIGVCASTPGVVTTAGWSGGYGKAVKIVYNTTGRKGKESYEIIYGHNSQILVKVGQTIKRGKLIAKAGSTGRSTGTHLHFEVRKNGKPVDPLIFLWR
jgi:murein DD-endopeptidase MepM/ murein hydrolase activator NlpD